MLDLEQKENQENMSAKKIKAPAKILWTLRFKTKCKICGSPTSSDKVVCDKCKKSKKSQLSEMDDLWWD